ncbi:hypothetical protein GF318_02690 [Candidatus Micrarchaeota archaeon]|nr:hypothetical protein [Candidatus Micrarchaeota archaeon]
MLFSRRNRVKSDSKARLPYGPRRDSRPKELELFQYSLQKLGIMKHGILTAFFDGTLGEHVNTRKGRKELDGLASDSNLFSTYLDALSIPGATKIMSDFLKTPEGIEAFVRVGKIQSGLTVLVKVGQTGPGRQVARNMLKSPLRGWPAIFRILKRLGQETKIPDEKEEPLPSISLAPFMNSQDPAAEILPMLRNREMPGKVFVSLSESDENASLCCRILKNPEARSLLFDYLVLNPDSSADTFGKLFRSEERRKRMSDIFMSRGGTKLLAKLAADVNGRALMTRLAISPHGRKTGIKVLLYHPITVIRVGWNYFRKPKTGT